ncbi:alkaline phosphatase family protein [Paenibacillus sp. GCM10028914]|uniref:alkaline phosphatase family protein n=1 Tax=Paenibacillus sp. GCM10028914 TaxID=3273416 RepID=UPI00362375FC
MWKKTILTIILILAMFTCFGCQRQEAKHKEQDLVHVKSSKGEQTKKVIYVMVDSLMAQAIDRGIQQKELPTFKFLIDNGQYHKDLVSSFPTMSVTIDSSLITGVYPDHHRVPGLVWYSADDKKVINYSVGPKEAIQQGVDPFLFDALVNLNGKHLNQHQPTIFEDLSRKGLKAGSINGLIYRGTKEHTLSIPPWIEVPTSLPKEIQVKGPDYMALGSLTNPLKGTKKLPDGVTRRIGINNQFSLETANYLITENKLPDFLYVYLPDLDQKLHKHGPSELKGVKEVDNQLHSLLQSFGSPEEALKKAVFIISGDSGMTQILSEPENSKIDLPSFFKDYEILRTGETVTDDTEVAFAVNETMAYVYKLNTDKSLRDMAHLLVTDPRIDFVSWKEKGWIHAVKGDPAKEVLYKAGGKLVDPYKQNWTVKQNSNVLDLKINTLNKSLTYGQYPDALQRLYGALHSHAGEFLVVTAKPGYELADRSSTTHAGGGGHGSLHQEESLVPLIITGTNKKPQYLRIVDLKSFITSLF